jgi:ABC-type antimicrobial peptide transport system ATPase subunit
LSKRFIFTGTKFYITCGTEDYLYQDSVNFRAAAVARGLTLKEALARVLVHDPPVLLLDEPASGLDPRAAQDIVRLVRQIAERHGGRVRCEAREGGGSCFVLELPGA